MTDKSQITLDSLRRIPLSYASCSIGKPSDSLQQRLEAITNAGFTAIELSFPDIKQYAENLLNKQVGPNDFQELSRAAQEIGKGCKQLNLEIMMLQPFSNFEGWPKGSPEREQAFTKAKGWIQLMKECGTDLLQVNLLYPSPFSFVRRASIRHIIPNYGLIVFFRLANESLGRVIGQPRR